MKQSTHFRHKAPKRANSLTLLSMGLGIALFCTQPTSGWAQDSQAVTKPAKETRPRLAVLPLRTNTIEQKYAAALDNLLVSALAESGKYEIISAGDIDAMLGFEKMKAAVGCDDVQCAAEIAGALGVR